MQILERSISELLKEDPRRARIFDQFAIKYCGCSQLTLAEVCQKNHINPEKILKSFEKNEHPEDDSFISTQIGDLCDQIVSHHHHYAREQGARIWQILEKVCRIHGEREPRFLQIQTVFDALYQDLLTHMQKEEMVLFPFCKELEKSSEAVSMHCGSVANPIRVMLYEHELAGQQTKQIETLTDQFNPPDWACNSMRVLYHELQAYNQDLELHMHLENNILFPAAMNREESSRPLV